MFKRSLLTAAILAAISIPAAAQEPEPEPDDKPGLFGTSFLEGWDRRFTLGIDGEENDSPEFNFFTLLELDYTSDYHRWNIDVSYDYGTEEHDLSDNEFLFSVLKDWVFPDKTFFYWAHGSYEYDEFDDYRQRWTGFGGLGLNLYKDEKHLLDGRAGLGIINEVDPSDTRPEGVFGLEYKWKINDNQDFFVSNYVFPNLEDLTRYRNETVVDWIIKMDAAEGLSLRIGLENEYDMNVTGGSKRNDLNYRLALVIDF
ncbi:DUF481 domain-containing protein [Mucisphaera calidilacus]|uniref:DUF481 domain-containing protein n=1 Tax=Mucisphaera calidilacus TaxID=2527982 RepID=A0A518BXU9_9BACT|nr:DUF481 domain-containing protein [Mucisphaera calidilacus]QDU71809.1 hypothetical protein Pan265_16620 [Mucisphaera calidilacus]